LLLIIRNVDALSFSIASFTDMFQWTLPQKIQLAKGGAVRCVLANCKDDIHSFTGMMHAYQYFFVFLFVCEIVKSFNYLDEVLEFIGYQHKIDGKIKRQIRRKILDAVCEKLSPVIFPMYNIMVRHHLVF
jgi:hypothetical protein